jgi:membrane associated rhomboid family serine protease
MESKDQFTFKNALAASLTFVVILFLVKGIEVVFRLPLSHYGIVPRTLMGLPGILFCPLLHANFHHLLANSIPLFVLVTLLLSNTEYHPLRTLSAIWIVSGLGTWLIGRGHSVHIGASAIIFGLAAFLVVAGFRIKSWKSVLIALLVLFFYGGIFYGVLPQAGAISWEGHLCGALAGIWIAMKTPTPTAAAYKAVSHSDIFSS